MNSSVASNQNRLFVTDIMFVWPFQINLTHRMSVTRLRPLHIAEIASAAHRFIEVYDREKLVTLRLSESIFRGEQQLLRFQHLE